MVLSPQRRLQQETSDFFWRASFFAHYALSLLVLLRIFSLTVLPFCNTLAFSHSYPLNFLSPCPCRGVSQPARRYRRFMHAVTLTEALELGAQDEDISQCYCRGCISFPQHGPDIPGHTFNTFSLDTFSSFPLPLSYLILLLPFYICSAL